MTVKRIVDKLMCNNCNFQALYNATVNRQQTTKMHWI